LTSTNNPARAAATKYIVRRDEDVNIVRKRVGFGDVYFEMLNIYRVFLNFLHVLRSRISVSGLFLLLPGVCKYFS